MIPVGKLLLSAVTSLAAVAAWSLFRLITRQYTTPLRHLRGPKASSWIFGNFGDIQNAEGTEPYESWVKEHGNTTRWKGLFGANRLFTTDTRAINHILTHSSEYHKPSGTKYRLGQIFGQGLLVVEGAQHRQQRHIMNPAFGPGQIRALTDIFLAKAIRLRDLWFSEIARNSDATTTGARIDVMPWLYNTTLDIIGLAGFNYNFDSLNGYGKLNELNSAFTTLSSVTQGLDIWAILQDKIPALRLIPSSRSREIRIAQGTVVRIGKVLLTKAKEGVRANASEKGGIETSSLEGRDILTLLVKANMATDIPDNQRLSDEDVLAHAFDLIISTPPCDITGITWTLFALSQVPDVQTKLREELLSVETETPSTDDLMSLAFLDAVIRETLRDELLPVETPYTDRYGIVHDTISQQGRSDRYPNPPEAVSHIPGIWGNMLTFIGGPRACIGFRFSLMEMTAVLFTLVRAFEFKLAVPSSDVDSKTAVVRRPVLRSDPSHKAQLPMLIRPYART